MGTHRTCEDTDMYTDKRRELLLNGTSEATEKV